MSEQKTDDLWPRDFTPIVDDPAPVVVLQQQASLLSGKTGGRVELLPNFVQALFS